MSTETSSPSKQAEHELNLMLEANNEFDKGNYDRCLQILDQLEQSGNYATNGKLQHNRAVVEFYKSGCEAHSVLLKQLNELDIDEVDVSNGKSLITACSNLTAKYNKAIVYYHRHMYQTSMDILEPLIHKLDALEKELSIHVSLMMLKLLIVTNRPRKAQAFLEYLQRHFNIKVEGQNTEETQLGKEINLLPGQMHTFKLLAILINILNGKTVTICEDASIELSALKAHQYYMLKDFQMAAKQLMKINNSTCLEGARADELNTCIANNMGVIHLRVRHYAIAASFFQHAIHFDKRIAANVRSSSLYEIGSARSCEILYNLGISMLYLRRPKEAFQCFLVPLKCYHSNSRLWLRMAEACIMDQQMKSNEEENKRKDNAGNTKVDLTNCQPVKSYTLSCQSVAVPELTLDFAVLCLRNALSLTLSYKSHVHESTADQETSSESEQIIWQTTKDNNFCSPSRPISKESIENMLSAIYAAYSYVSMRLGDYVMALEMAENLLNLEKLSDAHRLLGHMYAGQALLMMNQMSKALPHLEPTRVSNLNAFDFETKDWEMKSTNAAQNVMRYNLAVALTSQGDLKGALTQLSTCTHSIVAAKANSLKKYVQFKLGQFTQ